MKKRVVIVTIALIFVFLAACSGAASCDEFLVELDAIVERWDDANAIASSSSRMSMSGPIADLQEIRREANAMEVPECGQETQALMIDFMDKTIGLYIAFLGQEDDDTVTNMIVEAQDAQDEFIESWVSLRGQDD